MKVIAKVPHRLHLSVKDMRTFDYGYTGGGGIGIAISKFTKLSVEISNNKNYAIGKHKKLILNHMLNIQNYFNIKEKFRVELLETHLQHIGLGTSSNILVGLLASINVLINLGLSDNDMLDYIFYSCKEIHKNKITSSFETMVGPYLNLYGGLLVVNTNGKLEKRIEVPSVYKVLLVFPKVKPLVMSEEKNLLCGDCRKFDELDYFVKEYIFKKILDSMSKKEYNLIFNYIDLLRLLGSKKIEIENLKNIDVSYKYLTELANENKIILAMVSSVGPVFCFVDKNEKLLNVVKDLGEKQYVYEIVEIANDGYKLRIER